MKLMNISNAEYHADRDHISKTWLDKINISPAHFQHYLNAHFEPTPDMILGSLVHELTLEGHSHNYVIAPECNRRTKEGKALYASFLEENQGKTIVSEEIFNHAEQMRDAVYKNKIARALLSNGKPEQSVFFNDVMDAPCKARADWLRDDAIVDLKTSKSAVPSEFAKSIANFRYHVQAAHYLQGFKRERFIFIVVEKTAPFGVAVYDSSEELIEQGYTERDRNIETFLECQANNDWPGYPEEILTVQLPTWARQ